VRLLVPNGTDIPMLRPLSRAGYRLLLESGVRVFEWNGTMLHAKTAVADGRWARVGSTNLNVASWFGNWELDAVIEDEAFAAEMEQVYRDDLRNTTEIVLDEKHKIRALGARQHRHASATSGDGSGGRVAAGALRIGNAVGAAFADRRVLGSVEARVAAVVGLLLCLASILFLLLPRVLQYPVVVLCAWGGLSLLHRAVRLRRRKRTLE
jgi:cardiolipin synthase